VASKPKRGVTFRAASCIKQQFRSYLAEFPEIAETIKAFNDKKREIPPSRLPDEMQDHKLDFGLKGIRECHLADDVLLLYEHKDDVVSMLYICRHDDLYGRRAKQLATRIKKLLEELEKKDLAKRKPN
jgi:mRNA-degrading endonuclease YafQ of YafQ-DinJ toxin-antitoxin module